nr:PREDICTED: steroidogenic acute regulatory protein, mitochondrial-like [Latimeria chalumnae]|eukprot:XP_005991454.1 PREDICTED: steroidogenic acute regulatory protein, mitochondrial-like [Latimeria chalumnae]
MLPATFKLVCGISHQHFQNVTGLKKEDRKARVQMFSTTELSYVKQGEEALQTALKILEQEDGWQTEIKNENGDQVMSKVLPGTGKVFRMEAILEATTEQLYSELFEKLEQMEEWNPSVNQLKVLKRIGKETLVTHEIATATAGNLIGQRDFVSVRYSWRQGPSIYLAGAATQTESMPPQKGFVRAEAGPTCIVLKPLENNQSKTHFTWLLSMDLKGWLPKSIINQALSQAQADFTKYLRQRLSVSNIRAWMTSDIFSEWVKKSGREMECQKCKVLLFIDNCLTHPRIATLEATMIFLPPNSTSKLQPSTGQLHGSRNNKIV